LKDIYQQPLQIAKYEVQKCDLHVRAWLPTAIISWSKSILFCWVVVGATSAEHGLHLCNIHSTKWTPGRDQSLSGDGHDRAGARKRPQNDPGGVVNSQGPGAYFSAWQLASFQLTGRCWHFWGAKAPVHPFKLDPCQVFSSTEGIKVVSVDTVRPRS
jgi:hypothetical protein